MCAANEYAAVLMDCQMPGLDGFEATRRIRAAGRPNLPIIALTAGAGDIERQFAIKAGMDDFLPKPIRRDDLRAALGRWLVAPAPQPNEMAWRDPQLVSNHPETLRS
jgi:hypothetical protein